MSTENKELESTAEVHNILPGEMLRKRREELGLSQKDISEKLRLKVSVIESIETNQFDNHHVATFIRGYFRSYAKMVGIKEKEILAALEKSGRGQQKEQPMHSFSKKTEKQQHDSRIMGLTWGILIIILGISSVWWWQNHQQDTLSPSSFSQSSSDDESNTDDFQSIDATANSEVSSDEASSSDEAVAEETAPQENMDLTLEQDSLAPETSSESEPASSTTEDAVEAPASNESTEIAQITSSEQANNVLAMQFKEDCWIQVKDSSGAVLATGLKKAGESLTLTGKTPYSIILGAPQGVSITLADEPVDLSKYTAGKVARMTLP
ncbi:cytoskeleton protein RodZ [Vibrio gangliei]|uniref:cytoskeleton protein RodZ n=1 Tax=Vibrio gangliei TaxID=2077090 RepID=UPI000D012F38|nr:cytoskeleton protein RodZ [Vibrio gangliei]